MGKLKVLMGLGAAGAAASAVEYGIARYFFRRTMIRKNAKEERTEKMAGTDWSRYIPDIQKNRMWMEKQACEEAYIKSRDGLKLFGTWFPALDPSSKKVVICFHGYSSEGMKNFTSLGRFYMKEGYNVLIIDERAHGKSEGEYIGFGCLDRYDALEWIQYARDKMNDNCEIILHGISMGGATVLMTSGLNLPSCVKAIISDCAFTSAWEVFCSVLKITYHMPAFPVMHIADEMCKRQAGFGLNECNAAVEVQKAKVPILFIHGDGDTFVPYRMCHELYHKCASPKDILIIKGASHAEAFYKEPDQYRNKILEFLDANAGGNN